MLVIHLSGIFCVELSKNNCSIGLVITSLIILVVNCGYITADSLDITAGVLTVSGIKVTDTLFLPIFAFSLLIVFCICHVKHTWSEISNHFSSGYRESPDVVELVRSTVAIAVNNDSHGSPRTGIRGSLIRRKTNLGCFTKTGGGLSKPVIFAPDAKTHIQAVFHGLLQSIAPSLLLRVYAPLLFAFIGLLSIAE